MRELAASLIGVAGLVCIVIGAAAVSAAAGWIIGGAAALWVAQRLS